MLDRSWSDPVCHYYAGWSPWEDNSYRCALWTPEEGNIAFDFYCFGVLCMLCMGRSPSGEARSHESSSFMFPKSLFRSKASTSCFALPSLTKAFFDRCCRERFKMWPWWLIVWNYGCWNELSFLLVEVLESVKTPDIAGHNSFCNVKYCFDWSQMLCINSPKDSKWPENFLSCYRRYRNGRIWSW